MKPTATKRKRVSKRNKVAWRKHVNIDDVEQFLDDQRLEERLGGNVSALPNEELFKIDTAPTELSAREKKRLRLQQPPKCFAMLQPHTKVPDPIKKRNHVIKKSEKRSKFLGIPIQQKRKKTAQITPEEIENVRRAKKHKRDEFNTNIWVEEEKLAIEKNEWLNDNTKKHNMAGTGNKRKTIKAVKRKGSNHPSVEIPHPGMSYNPSFVDHQQLLREIADKETKIIKEEKHLDRVTKDMFSKVTAAKRDSDWMSEMSQNLPTGQSQSTNASDDETDDEYKSVNAPVKNVKKTLKQRRKQKEQMKLQLQRKAIKQEKRKNADLNRLKALNSKLTKIEAEEQLRKEKHDKANKLKEKEVKRLALRKFEEAEAEFNMGQDISGNLRNMKQEGNLLKDRFKSLQRRSIIEPSIRQLRKKPKVKKYTKPGHKDDDWKKSVARELQK